jgi:hypothetical protein
LIQSEVLVPFEPDRLFSERLDPRTVDHPFIHRFNKLQFFMVVLSSVLE